MKSILLVKKLLGLVEMTSGLVPKWQAVKTIFFAPWHFLKSVCVSVRSLYHCALFMLFYQISRKEIQYLSMSGMSHGRWGTSFPIMFWVLQLVHYS